MTEDQVDTCFVNAKLILHMADNMPDDIENNYKVRLLAAFYIAKNNCNGLERVSKGLPFEPSEEETEELHKANLERF